MERLLACAMALSLSIAAAAADTSALYSRQPTWQETLLASRQALRGAALSEAERRDQAMALWQSVQTDFPLAWDWSLQDYGAGFTNWFGAGGGTEIEQRLIEPALQELGGEAEPLRKELQRLQESRVSGENRGWLDLYVKACERRRALRLRLVLRQAPRIVFTKHPTLFPSFFAYTEGQSDAQNERHFAPGAALCVLEMEGLQGRVRTLLEDPTGAIRDPAVSWDGQRVLFAWKKSLEEDDYHLYELELAGGSVRQLTFGAGFADYEPAYLPNGDIVFASTRCVQTVDCWWTEVSNLYTCDPDGRYLRRLGFDQVHAIYPQVLEDGRVIYTALGLQRPRPDLSPGALPDEPRRHRPDRVLRQQLLVSHHHRPRPRHSGHGKGPVHLLRPPHRAGRQAGGHRPGPGPPGKHRRPADRPAPRHQGRPQGRLTGRRESCFSTLIRSAKPSSW